MYIFLKKKCQYNLSIYIYGFLSRFLYIYVKFVFEKRWEKKIFLYYTVPNSFFFFFKWLMVSTYTRPFRYIHTTMRVLTEFLNVKFTYILAWQLLKKCCLNHNYQLFKRHNLFKKKVKYHNLELIKPFLNFLSYYKWDHENKQLFKKINCVF